MRPNDPGNDDRNTLILNVHSELNLILFKGDSGTIVSHSHSAWVHFSEHTHRSVVCSLPFYSPLLCSPEHLRPRSRWSSSVSRVCGLHSSSAWQQHVGERTRCACSGVCCVNPDATRSFADCMSATESRRVNYLSLCLHLMYLLCVMSAPSWSIELRFLPQKQICSPVWEYTVAGHLWTSQG